MKEKERIIIEDMINNMVIPKEGNFEITEEMIDYYCNRYDQLFSKGRGVRRTGNLRYARKLAGLSLIKINESRQTTEIKIKKKPKIAAGFVYIISNPAFENCYKIGFTKDINTRLETYQTYDPHRRFKIEHYEFCLNAREKEKILLEKYSLDLIKGEWIKKETLTEIVEVLFNNSRQAN